MDRLELEWLEDERIPAKLVHMGRRGTYALELRELRTTPAAEWPQARIETLDD